MTPNPSAPVLGAPLKQENVEALPRVIPRWKCFLKAMTATHIILCFTPASFDDLRLLVQGQTIIQISSQAEEGAKPHAEQPGPSQEQPKAENAEKSSRKAHSSGEKSERIRKTSGDKSGKERKRHQSGEKSKSRHSSGDKKEKTKHFSGESSERDRKGHPSGEKSERTQHPSGEKGDKSRKPSGERGETSRHSSGDKTERTRHKSGEKPVLAAIKSDSSLLEARLSEHGSENVTSCSEDTQVAAPCDLCDGDDETTLLIDGDPYCDHRGDEAGVSGEHNARPDPAPPDGHPGDTPDTHKAFSIPVYVYNCPLSALSDQLVNKWTHERAEDIFQDLTFSSEPEEKSRDLDNNGDEHPAEV